MTPRRVFSVGLLNLIALLWLPTVVSAHPLGNFTINHYTAIVVAADNVNLRWVLDMAEIPAFSARQQIDTDRDGAIASAEVDAWLDATLPGLVDQLDLRLDGRRLPLQVTSRAVTFLPGQGGLVTLRLAVDMTSRSRLVEGTIAYRDLTYPERIGWHEIVVQSGSGVRLASSDAPQVSLSDELRHYPTDALTNPVNQTSATARFERSSGTVASATPKAAGGAAGGRGNDLLADLVDGNLSLVSVVLALLLAIGLGAAHAASPGHGKTLVAAYLIGSRGSLAQAVWLGITVAVTHTLGVLLLGAVTLVATEVLVPERLITWLSLGSGLLVIGLGGSLLWRHWRGRDHERARRSGHAHPHPHPHAHPHSQAHDVADPAPALSRAGIAALGLVGGMVPSASALLVLLVAVTTGRVVFGMTLIVAFGAGMAMVLTAVSASVVLVRRRVDAGGAGWTRHAAVGRALKLVPVASALAVLTIGVVLSIGAARALG